MYPSISFVDVLEAEEEEEDWLESIVARGRAWEDRQRALYQPPADTRDCMLNEHVQTSDLPASGGGGGGGGGGGDDDDVGVPRPRGPTPSLYPSGYQATSVSVYSDGAGSDSLASSAQGGEGRRRKYPPVISPNDQNRRKASTPSSAQLLLRLQQRPSSGSGTYRHPDETFQPIINKKSVELAQKKKDIYGTDVPQCLKYERKYFEARLVKQRREEARKEQEAREMEACSFQPKINDHIGFGARPSSAGGSGGSGGSGSERSNSAGRPSTAGSSRERNNSNNTRAKRGRRDMDRGNGPRGGGGGGGRPSAPSDPARAKRRPKKSKGERRPPIWERTKEWTRKNKEKLEAARLEKERREREKEAGATFAPRINSKRLKIQSRRSGSSERQAQAPSQSARGGGKGRGAREESRGGRGGARAAGRSDVDLASPVAASNGRAKGRRPMGGALADSPLPRNGGAPSRRERTPDISDGYEYYSESGDGGFGGMGDGDDDDDVSALGRRRSPDPVLSSSMRVGRKPAPKVKKFRARPAPTRRPVGFRKLVA